MLCQSVWSSAVASSKYSSRDVGCLGATINMLCPVTILKFSAVRVMEEHCRKDFSFLSYSNFLTQHGKLEQLMIVSGVRPAEYRKIEIYKNHENYSSRDDSFTCF